MSLIYDLAELDRLLSDYESRFSVLEGNLEALLDDFDFKMLTSRSLHGKTAAEFSPAASEFVRLADLRFEVAVLLSNARKLRQNLPLVGREAKVNELGQALKGRSIELPVLDVPLHQRGASTPAQVRQGQSIEEWLDQSGAAFDKVNALLRQISSVWSFHAQIASSQTQCEALVTLASQLGEPQHPELLQVRERIERSAGELEGDPLSFDAASTGDLQSRLDTAQAALEKLSKGRDNLLSEIRRVLASLKELEEIYRQTEVVVADCRLKVCEGSEPKALFDKKVISDLATWLGRINDTAKSGNWRASLVGLQNIQAQIAQRKTEAKEAEAGNRGLLAYRQELRGRLDALRATAQGTGLAEDSTLAAKYEEAHACLYTRPTSLVRGEKLVNEYSALLH